MNEQVDLVRTKVEIDGNPETNYQIDTYEILYRQGLLMTDIDWANPDSFLDEALELIASNGSDTQNQEILEYAFGISKRNEEGAVQIILKALESDDHRLLHHTLNLIATIFGHRIDLLESVKEFLGHESEDVRMEAVNALGSFRTVNSLNLIIDSLWDESEKVRWCAVVKIPKFGKCRVQEPWLLELRNVESERFAKEISKSIQWNHNSFPEVAKSVDRLIEMFGNSTERTRISIIKTLGCIDDQKTVSPLLDALLDDNAGVRAAAAYSLGTKAEESAVDSLIDLLKDDSFAVRFLAAEALGIIKDEKAIQPLANAWSTEEDYADQKEAMKLIYNHISK